MCNYGFASVLLSLPQKGVMQIMSMRKLKSKVEICKLPSMTLVFWKCGRNVLLGECDASVGDHDA